MDYIVESPYPKLSKQGGIINQIEYFLEPAKPAVNDIGSQTAFLPDRIGRVYNFPAGFGTGYRIYNSTRFDGFVNNLYFVRRNQGDIDHGIQRSNSDAYEQAKFNRLLHPGDDEKNTCFYDKPGDWKTMPEYYKNMLKLKTWPLNFEVPTRAPFAKSRFDFSMPAANQPTLLGSMCATPEIFQLVLGCLIDSWETVSNLGRTCQLMFKTIGEDVMHCDLTSGDFLDIDKSPDTLRRLVIKGKRTRKEAKMVAVSPFVIVSPMRRELNESQLSKHGRLNAYGYEDNEDIQFNQTSMIKVLVHNFKLYRAIQHRPEQFRHLLLQRATYINIYAAKAIMRSLPNLETIGIHNCDLMTFGDTAKLVEAVRDINLDRAKRNSKVRLNLDFYPRYYQGPIKGSLGCFGVIPHDEGCLETHKSVVAALVHILRLATAARIDLLSPGKAFRRWLDKVPFHLDTLPYILTGILNMISYRNGAYGNISTLGNELKRNMEETLWADIIVATNGAPMRQEVLKPGLVSELKEDGVHLLSCRDCHEELPRWFFRETYADRRDAQKICSGCELVWYLDHHTYDMHLRKRDIADALWDYGRIEDVKTLMEGPNRPTDNESLAETMRGLPDPGVPTLNHRLREAKRKVRNMNHFYFQDMHEISRLKDRIALLKQQSDTLPGGSFAMYQNGQAMRDVRKRLMIFQIRAGCGQWAPEPQQERALSWQKLIKRYRGLVAIETGQLVNQGLVPLMNKEAFADDCTGF